MPNTATAARPWNLACAADADTIQRPLGCP